MTLLSIFKRKSPRAPLPAETLHTIEEKLKAIDGVPLHSARSYDYSHIPASTFQEWYAHTLKLQDPDKIRNALYYGFQPTFDLLISDQINDELKNRREAALLLLEKITFLSRRYLYSYYAGQPDTARVHEDLSSLASQVTTLADVLYRKKERNIDNNTIYPPDIHSFLVTYLTQVLDQKIEYPQVIVGAACGSSEVALSLAEIFGIPVTFMRMSKKREDTSIKVVREHRAIFREIIPERDVTCVEDYVCTRRSLKEVMKETKTYHPASILGVALRDSHEAKYLRSVTQKKGFHIFELR